MNILKIITSIILITTFFSCKKDMAREEPLTDLLISGGPWIITTFVNKYDTTSYILYSLNFHNDGKMQLSRYGISKTGTWRTYADPSDFIYLQIEMPYDDHRYLEGDWMKTSMNARRIEFSTGHNDLTNNYMTLSSN